MNSRNMTHHHHEQWSTRKSVEQFCGLKPPHTHTTHSTAIILCTRTLPPLSTQLPALRPSRTTSLLDLDLSSTRRGQVSSISTREGIQYPFHDSPTRVFTKIDSLSRVHSLVHAVYTHTQLCIYLRTHHSLSLSLPL